MKFSATKNLHWLSGAALAALLLLPACHYDFQQNNDYGEQFMQSHLQNGDMTQDQYNQNVKVFQVPANASGSGTAGTAKGTVGSAASGS